MPELKNTLPTPGCGAGKSDAEWIGELVAFRSRMLALSNFELSAMLSFSEYGDLIGLVIAPPYDATLLERLVSLLDEEVGKALSRDCRMLRHAWPGSDLACRTCENVAGLLEFFDIPRASAERMAALRTMALELASKPDTSWFLQRYFFLYQLFPIISLAGGLEGELGLRIEALACEEEWRYLEAHYPDYADEPLFEGVANWCEQGLTAMLVGQAWEPERELLDDDLAQDEINALLDSWWGPNKERATALLNLLKPMDDEQIRLILANMEWSGAYSVVLFLASCKDMEFVRRVLRNCPEQVQGTLIATLVAWCDEADVRKKEEANRGMRRWLNQFRESLHRVTGKDRQ